MSHTIAHHSLGKPYEPKQHEYQLPGYDQVRDEDLSDGMELLLRLLRAAELHSITFLMISAMTDFAQLIRDEPELVIQKVRHLCAMGGLQKNAAGEWEPDTAVNNMWDLEAAQLMYHFCFEQAIPMSVISRNAVPNLPMKLAKDCAAQDPNNTILQYLVNAQQLGLTGLWQNLCAGKLPARCTKRWYMATFCGVEDADFDVDALDQTADITSFLNGSVKPYDVCALMLALPNAHSTFALQPYRESSGDVTHSFFLDAANMVDVNQVAALLRTTFRETVRLARCSSFTLQAGQELLGVRTEKNVGQAAA